MVSFFIDFVTTPITSADKVIVTKNPMASNQK